MCGVPTYNTRNQRHSSKNAAPTIPPSLSRHHNYPSPFTVYYKERYSQRQTHFTYTLHSTLVHEHRLVQCLCLCGIVYIVMCTNARAKALVFFNFWCRCFCPLCFVYILYWYRLSVYSLDMIVMKRRNANNGNPCTSTVKARLKRWNCCNYTDSIV